MRIEELIIDGFKSYPVRTHVRGFDASFNAITGLNGSGKSNILDAICFVLGLTNLSSVRAANIQDLIYKRGQAGVTKASVTIVFDNSERAKSPVSFENYANITVTRQIAMGGVSKYLINGHKATQQAVQNLFQSVQLNINNPNFLIMQGKITKVLNMKPPEILSMIEEAAGTRMFEERKERAFRTMAKKDQKVREITSLLEEEITPKLDRLRDEKRAFLEFQKTATELERLTRLSKAHEWHSLRTQLDERTRGGIDDVRAQIAAHTERIVAWTRHIAGIQDEIARLEHARERRRSDGSESLTARSKRLAHALVDASTQREFRRAALVEETQERGAADAALAAATDAREARQSAMDALRADFDAFMAVYDAANVRSVDAESLLQSLLTGVASGSEHGAGSFQAQLARARADESAAKTERQQAALRVEHLQRELRSREQQLSRDTRDGDSLGSELADTQRAVADAQRARDAQHFDHAAADALRAERVALESEIAALDARRTRLQDALPAALQFQYDDPSPHFDRARVKGLIAGLITLSPEHHAYAGALETCAGGRLYNVVVSDEAVGSQLLKHGRLKKRVTIIPLNKIQAGAAPPARVGAAQELAPGSVHLALSLVGYEAEVAAALEYVFGHTLVCRDAATARRVTFDEAVKMKSVTLDGDVYDPAGTLSGGSKQAGGGGVLLRMQELATAQDDYERAVRALRDTGAAHARLDAQAQQCAQLDEALALKMHHVQLLQQQMNVSRTGVLQAEIATARDHIAAQTSMADAAAQREEAAAAGAAALEREIAELSTDKDSKVARVRADVKERKAELAALATALKARQSALRSAEMELEQLQTDRDCAAARLVAARDAQALAEREDAAASDACAALQQEADACDAELATERAAHSAHDGELAQLQAACAAKRAAVGDAELAAKQLAHTLERAEAECARLTEGVAALEAAHPWILAEQSLFGTAGSAYEFTRHNMADVRRMCEQLEEQQSGQKRKINPRVMHMIDNVEKKESSLQTMLTTVLKDKSKIEQTIAELDRYKKDALQATFSQVNHDFGGIFGELLPGNDAQLAPPEGAEITQGLEVRVRLGATWKESLTELSGGQRSLIALSLIMSLLQFKPAPMYILDEIDAALDLSHTQHIGHLFRTRFKGSQFIVVSLKEGLFTNANVLFRARFRDGTSLVERITQKRADDKENHRDRRVAFGKQARVGRADGFSAVGAPTQ
ncbi:Structural maintenance of chromosomes protein 2 [Malassezia sp. CBS 17886]|nr:Structural maintenance of chromosomes protein 2 [Malassezia sp. CBS 17886]